MIAPQRHNVHKGHAYELHCFEPVALHRRLFTLGGSGGSPRDQI